MSASRSLRIAAWLWLVAIVVPSAATVVMGVAWRNNHPEIGIAAFIGSTALATMAAACAYLLLAPFRLRQRHVTAGAASVLVVLVFAGLFAPWFWLMARYDTECNGGEEPTFCSSNPARHFPWG